MKSIIYKYELSHGINRIEMPFSAGVISVAAQMYTPVLWAILDDRRILTSTRMFRVVMTGEEFDRGAQERYIGTLTRVDGVVMHVFEIES
jgi:hypothetical protein